MSNLELYQCDSYKNFREWNSAFMQVFNKHAPVKSKRVKCETQPDWYTDDIKNATKIEMKVIRKTTGIITNTGEMNAIT